MCVDVDEPWEPVWSHDDAVSLPGQTFRCNECDRAFTPGEHHVWEFLAPLREHYCDDETCDPDDCTADSEYLDEDEGSEWRFCFQCLAAREWLSRVCHAWMYGGVEDDLINHTMEMYPIASLPLARLVVGMRNDWRKRDGSLYDPELVERWANQGAQLVADHLKRP